MDVMEYKIVDRLYPWQISVGDIIKVEDELVEVCSVEDNDDDIEIFYTDDFGETDYEVYESEFLIPIYLPFD